MTDIPTPSHRKATLVSARGLTKSYGKTPVVNAVDFDIPENSFTTILGPSGCGKSTLLRLIAGLEAPDSGTLELDGRDLIALKPEERAVNTVFQSYALFPHMTVFENVAFAPRIKSPKGADLTHLVNRALRMVKIEDLAPAYPATLSGGQQQRVALARAIVADPLLLLLDEPLSALDRNLRAHLQVELRSLQQRLKRSFVFVTHDQGEAFALSDQIIVMYGGKIQQAAAPEEIWHRPANQFVAGFIGESCHLHGVVHRSGSEASIHTQIGRFTAPTLDDLKDGDQGVLILRPEHVTLDAHGPLEGRLQDISYLGESYLCTIICGDAQIKAYTSHPISPGTDLRFAIAQERVFITRPGP